MAGRKTRRERSEGVHSYIQRRPRFEAVLRRLGIWEGFAAMPRRAQDLCCQQKFPDPVLEFDGSFPADRDGRTLRRTLERAFREAVVEVGGVGITVRDFYSVLAGLTHVVMVNRSSPELPEACKRFMNEVWPSLDQWYAQNANAGTNSLHRAVVAQLVARSRFDGKLLALRLKQDTTDNGKSVLRMTVGATEPQVRHVRLDGASRPMYRVGVTYEWEGFRWVGWNGGQIGGEGRPVYVQSHALRQLHERVNLPAMGPYLHSWLAESLDSPNVVERQGDDLLVEYRIHDHRLGYLVVTPLEDVVAVRTFKFLTMENTPEARKLRQRLRLTRRDVDWLGLHELAAFTRTDLCEDPLLRALMEECGCGHLFSLADDDVVPTPRAYAAEVRRYLRLAA